ncbi:MAG: zinc ABC transporter substrate-binding protein [Bacteroidetes bacterium]|nr:zinc ABC transporter substrate-binding protein [Bacteroidota bacterium]
MRRHLISILGLISILTACQSEPNGKKNERTLILTTTGMLGDAVKNLCGPSAEVKVMMGPGVDPHLYKASQGDMQLISEADIIVYNGLHLEGKLVEILEKTARTKPVIVAGEFIDKSQVLVSENAGSAPDPHIWMNVDLWSAAISGVADTLEKLIPANAEQIKANADTYSAKLGRLNAEIDSLIHQIPESGRVLITSHDAFRYFGEAYSIEVKGLQGISTVSEYGLRDVSDMANLIIDRKIKSVFIETSVSSKSLQSVISTCQAKGWNVKIGGTLYSDSMGEDGTPDGTYEGMLRHNALTIFEALK